MLEEDGPEELQARKLTAEIGTSTQAIYTLFGGMPGLFEAMVADGFVRWGRYIAEVPETDDPVADHFSKGWAFCDWALAHPQLYRLMMGLTGRGLRMPGRPELSMSDTMSGFPEGRAALHVLMRSVDRIRESGRIQPVDSVVLAGQFLTMTHGYVLLEIGGAFSDGDLGLQIVGSLAINLMVGLGDSREAAERSLLTAVAARAAGVQRTV
jgi:AcrR family transcriptional regulator